MAPCQHGTEPSLQAMSKFNSLIYLTLQAGDIQNVQAQGYARQIW